MNLHPLLIDRGLKRVGSKADMTLSIRDVRFTPESGHLRATLGCPLCAKSGHRSMAVRGRRAYEAAVAQSSQKGRKM